MPAFIRTWFLPAVVALGVLGGSVAVAATSDGDDLALEDPTEITTTSTTAVPTEGDEDGIEDETESEDLEEGQGVERYWDADECGGDEVMNHGQYVVKAKSEGVSPSEAAHSPCGKPLSSVTPTTAPAVEDDEEVEGDDPVVDDTESFVTSTHGNGKGKGKGRPAGKGPKH